MVADASTPTAAIRTGGAARATIRSTPTIHSCFASADAWCKNSLGSGTYELQLAGGQV